MVTLRIRDPLVGSHILAGAAGSLFAVCVRDTVLLASGQLISFTPQSLNGIRFLTGGVVVTGLVVSAFATLGIVLVLVLLRLLLRRNWLADTAFAVLLVLFSIQVPQEIPGASVAAYFLIWLLRRFGLLALAAYVVVFELMVNMPWAAASWYTAYSLATPVLIAAVCACALYTILVSRPSLPG